MRKARYGLGRIVVHGAEPWRFVDRCAGEGIALRDVRLLDEFTLLAWVPVRSLERSRTLSERCGCTLELSGLSTLPRLRAFLRRRGLLLSALGLLLAALGASTLFVWEVEVVQNDSLIPDAQIVRVLAEQGVGVGSFWPAFRGERIRTRALLALPELRFLAVNVRGCRALVEARAAVPPPEIFDPALPRDLTAARSGVVASVVALAGEARAHRGDAVTAGQTLIAGTPASPHARGEVYAYTYRELTAVAPLTVDKKIPEERSRRQYALLIGTKRINFYRNSGNLPEECDKITWIGRLALGERFALPLGWACQTLTPCRTRPATLSADTAGAALRATLDQALRRDLAETDEVLAENFSAFDDGAFIRVTLRAQCLERIDTE